MYQTGLHIAAKTNNRVLMAKLISANAYIDAVDILHRTPLLLAAQRDNGEAVIELIVNGANPLICSNKGETPLNSTKKIFLKFCLEQAEKAHRVLNFVYSHKKRKEVLSKIKRMALLGKANITYALYNMLGKDENANEEHKMTFFELIKEAKDKLVKAQKNLIKSPRNTKSPRNND